MADEEIKVKFTGTTSDLDKASAAATKSLDKFSKSSNTSTLALSNLSRVAQDAPYGFIGIANNLNPLLESFQRLQKETGSTKASISALVGSLAGAGGVGLALGVVSSLLVVFGDKLFGASSKVAAGKQSITNLTASLRDLDQLKLEDISQKIHLDTLTEAAKQAGDSIANIERFSLALNNVSLSTEQRKNALEEYNKVAAKSNQLQESDLGNIDKVNRAINNQIELLKIRALIAGAQKQLGEQFAKVFNAQFNIKSLFDDATPSLQKLADVMGDAGKNAEDLSTGLTFDKSLQATDKFGKKFFDIQKGVRGTGVEIAKLTAFMNDLILQADTFGGAFDGVEKKGPKGPKDKFAFLFDFLPFDPNGKLKPEQQAELSKAVDAFSKQFGNVLQGVNFSAGTTSEAGAIQNAKDWWEGFKKGILKFKPPPLDIQAELNAIPVVKTGQDDTVFKFFQRGFQEEMDKQNIPLDLTLDKDQILTGFQRQFAALGAQLPKTITTIDGFGRPLKVDLNAEFNTARIEAGLAEALKKAQDTLKAIGAALTSTAQSVGTDAIAAFGEAVGTGLAGGDIANVFKSLFSTIGGAIANLGKQMIALSPLIQSIQLAIKSLNPALLLPAGIAMVALGSVIKASFANVKGFATGGLVFGPTLGMVGEGKGTSRSNPEVIAPLNKLKNIIGGGNSVNIPEFVEVRIHGDQLVGIMHIAQKARGRDR